VENILKLILWYRCGLVSEREFLNAINKIDAMQIPYSKDYKELTNVR